jgi:hypothetical protein
MKANRIHGIEMVDEEQQNGRLEGCEAYATACHFNFPQSLGFRQELVVEIAGVQYS